MNSPSLRIAIVSTEFITESVFDGGLANYTYRLAKSLMQFGHTPIVFVPSKTTEKIVFEGIEIYRVYIDKYDDWIYSNKYLCKPYTYVKRIFYKPLKWNDWETNFSLKTQSARLNDCVTSVHEQNKFNLIHYANLNAVGYYRPKNIPSIARMSGSTAIAFTFGGYGETYKEIMRTDKLVNKTLKKMDAIFGPCLPMNIRIGKKINRNIELIESMYIDEVTSKDTSIFDECIKGKKYLLFFGTLSQLKGVGTIAEIIYPFLEKHKDHYFVFVGKPSHSEIEGLTMLDVIKEKAGIYANRVIHVDKISHAKLFPILENSDFVALPSRIDNFPNTCIEAMAHGKIVIGTIGNGFEQLIDDKKSGFLIPVDAPDKLLQAIEEIILLSVNQKKQIEANAKKRIELLKPEHIVPQLISFYQKAIEKHNAN
jgi:glycogen synthase